MKAPPRPRPGPRRQSPRPAEAGLVPERPARRARSSVSEGAPGWRALLRAGSWRRGGWGGGFCPKQPAGSPLHPETRCPHLPEPDGLSSQVEWELGRAQGSAQ